MKMESARFAEAGAKIPKIPGYGEVTSNAICGSPSRSSSGSGGPSRSDFCSSGPGRSNSIYRISTF